LAERHGNWWISSIGSDQVELPTHPEAVGDPGEERAEAVVVDGHHYGAPGAQLVGKIAQLRFIVALDECRGRRREGEVVYRRAVVEHYLETGDADASHRDLPCLRAFRVLLQEQLLVVGKCPAIELQ